MQPFHLNNPSEYHQTQFNIITTTRNQQSLTGYAHNNHNRYEETQTKLGNTESGMRDKRDYVRTTRTAKTNDMTTNIPY